MMAAKSTAVSRKVEHCKDIPVDDTFIVKWLRSLKIKKLSELELILFGFAMILGNRSTGWNTGLTHGINAVWFNLFFSASGFFCLCLCMGEMSSALPFSGGVFGFVRAALGPFWGFLVATCEFVYCITAIALKAQRVFSNGSTSTSKNDSDAGGIVLIFGVCLLLNLIGGKPVFALTSVMGLLITSLLFIYLFGTLGNVGSDSINFTHYSPPDVDFTWVHIMSSRSAVGGLFNGMQFFPLLSPYLKEPREQLPRVMLISCSTFLVTTVFIILAAVSRDNGGKKLSSTSTPLLNGFGQIFDMDPTQAQYLDLPFQFSSVFCLFYCAGRQLLAITKSGLLPSFLEKTIPGADTPYYCYTFTAIVGVGLNLFVLYYPEHLAEVKAISSTSSVLIFIFCLIAFMIFRRKFSSMARSFVNPLGDFSAIYGIICFCFATIGLVFYTDVNPLFLVAIGGYLLFSTIFFWTYLVKNQKFSDEEKKIMFKAYLINANRNMRKNRLKNNKIGPCTNSGADNPSNSKCKNSSQGRAGASTTRDDTSIPDNVSSTRAICPAKEQKPIEETLLASTSVSRAASVLSSSQSSRQPEPVGSKKMSTKLIAFLSSKMNAVSPLLNQMDSKELQDYEQLAALSAGGIPNDEAEEALETRFGVDENVVERDVEAGAPEPDQLVVEEPEMNGN